MEMGDNLPGSIWPHVFWPVCFAQQYCPTVAGATVEITLTASGSVSDYSDTLILKLRSIIATAAGVDESLVTIRVTAASVIITATIFVPAGTTAAAVKDLLSASLGTAAAASALLGITVESAPTMVATEAQESNTPSSDSINVGVIVGAIAGGLAFVLLMIVIAVCAVKRSKNEATKKVAMATAPQKIEVTVTAADELSIGKQVATWLTERCGISASDAKLYADALAQLGIDTPDDLQMVDGDDVPWPSVIKPVHRKKIQAARLETGAESKI